MKSVTWNDRLVDRFFAFVSIGPWDDCWVWNGFRDPKGYGRFQYGSTDARLAYNVSYGLFVTDDLPAGLQLDHTCRKTHCVNPYHLEPVSHQENMRRRAGYRKGQEITQCPSGHPYTEGNTYVSPGGYRVCRTCRRASQRADKERKKIERHERGLKKPGRSAGTHCTRGHEYTEANTYVHVKSGIRQCRKCKADRAAGRL